MCIGKLFLNFNWTFGAAIIILTKVLLKYIAKVVHFKFQASRGKYQFYNCIGHAVATTKL